MNFRFVHAADLHLDTPFEGISRLGEGMSEVLRDASLQAFDNLIDLTISENADFLLIAGDVYDGAQRGIRAQLRFRQGMEKLNREGIRVFIVHGNHDPLDGWSAIRKWPDNVTIAGSEGVECHEVSRDGGTLACVYGISYARRDQRENLALLYRNNGRPGLHIGLLHCNAGGVADHENYSPCSVEDLAGTGMDYWALGHVHARRILHKGGPWIVYPGNLQGRSPKPTELGAKGAYVVDVKNGAIRDPRFVELDVVRFLHLDFSVEQAADVGELKTEMVERGVEEQAENGGRGVIIRALLHGASPVSADLRRPGGMQEFLSAVRDETAHRTADLWWESIGNRTSVPLDLGAIRRRDDFAAAVLARADDLLRNAEQASAFHDAAVDAIRSTGCLEAADEAVVREIIQEAKMLALSLLEEGRDG